MKLLLFSLSFLLFALSIGYFRQNIRRLYNTVTLFNEGSIVSNFRNMGRLGFTYNVANRGKHIASFHYDQQFSLPEYFPYDNQCKLVDKWLETNWVTGLVVLKVHDVTNATLLFEEYYRGNNMHSKVISWSTGKSIVSALVGIAVDKGYINSIDDPVTKYVPLLKTSGYDEVKIKDVLQMSSGVKFDENYADFFSEINQIGRIIALGGDLDTFMTMLRRKRDPGIIHNYISTDTQVLGMVVQAATNQSLTKFLEEYLWKRGGFECELYWLVDNDQTKREMAFGTINTCTADYARFGWLYLNGGKSPLDGTQLIDADWVKKSITPDAPHLMTGVHKVFPLGYGYQWWIPGSPHNISQPYGDYLAIGVYGQFIYINPMHNIVIAMNSANPNYNMRGELLEIETIELFRAIANKTVS